MQQYGSTKCAQHTNYRPNTSILKHIVHLVGVSSKYENIYSTWLSQNLWVRGAQFGSITSLQKKDTYEKLIYI
jgi:hypothetical protein